MTTPILGSTNARLNVGHTRPRTTARPRNRFTEVLRTGADILLAGAGVASGLVGGPLLSAAVGAARAGLGQLGGSAPGSSPLGSSNPGGSGSGSTGGGGLTSGGSSSTSEGGSGSSEVEAMRQLQQEGQHANLQYLKLQQEMQQSNRRFSLASSVLKAKHDTARAVLNNLRV